MRANELNRAILVPILDGDISEETLGIAMPLVTRERTHLVLMHVTPTAEVESAECHLHDAHAPITGPRNRRWQRLASAAPHRTFVEAVSGDPATVVREEAERFGSHTIVVSPPAPEP
jgi:nucleotide-binding universal stress UspA family protein